MRIPRLYLDADLGADTIELNKDRLHYLQRVLRLVEGATLRVFDGRGAERQATLRNNRAELGEWVDAIAPPPLDLILLQGLARGERMDQALQKSTELGVKQIVPLLSVRCEVKLSGERLRRRMAHWQGVIISACEQCGRADLPELLPVQSLQQWQATATTDRRLLLSPSAPTRLAAIAPPESPSIALAVGPEGGFEAIELERFEAAGFVQVNLGPRVLRTETAGPAALTAIQTLWGDFA